MGLPAAAARPTVSPLLPAGGPPRRAATLATAQRAWLTCRQPRAARARCLAAQKKARDKGRGQVSRRSITRVSLKVIGADGALIERRRQSNAKVPAPESASTTPRNAARLDIMIAPPSARRPPQAAGALRRPETPRRSAGRSWPRCCPSQNVPAIQDAATMPPRRPLLSARW